MHITNVEAKDHNLKERKLLKSYIFTFVNLNSIVF